ncbi:MAG: hypothetical protein NT121_23005 [Chloroflexi bacterium]|nr:hypothetical protein [Chloroflexota bacterium]
MFIFLLLMVLTLLGLLIFKPGWMPVSIQNSYRDKLFLQARRFEQKSGRWFEQVRRAWIGRQQNENLGIQLKAWVMIDLAAGQQVEELDDFRNWIASLSFAEADSLAQELSVFCWKQGFNILWLLEDNVNSEMQAAFLTMVIHYSLAVRERTKSRPTAALGAWQTAPLSRENREFGNLLYIQLVEAGLINIPAKLLLAPEKQRLAHQVSAIKNLLDNDPEALTPYAEQVIDIFQA